MPETITRGRAWEQRLPLYEYECEKNGHRFELIRKFSDPPLESCIHCRSKVRKLVSASAIAFKGSGWYVTDYAGKTGSGAGNGGGGKKSSGSEGGSGDGAGSSDTSSKAKPEKSEKPTKPEKKAKSGSD